MENQGGNISDFSPEVPPYLSLFRQHLNQLQEHLSGTTHAGSDSATAINGVEWESSEKDAFFHALSVYSRLRPDLIAASIQTKNEVEVLEYISLLEKAIQDNVQGKMCRKNLPLAHEVSDTWIMWEEENAERLRVNEDIWSTKGSPNDSGSISRFMDESLGPLSNILYLTYGHLVVVDSILKVDTAISSEGTSSIRSIAEVEPISSIQNLQSSSQFLSGSSCFRKNPASITPKKHPPSYQDMSPRSRRRHQKRMYMRRSRAKMSGGKADNTTQKLRPGSKRKSTQDRSESANMNIVGDQGTEPVTAVDFVMSKSQDPDGTADCTSELENTENEGDLPCSAPASRLAFQKAQSDLHNCHVNGRSIVAAGLDIFNHRRIGKLMRLFISGYEPQLISEDASIRTDLLFLLFEILKDFLGQVIARVIILEEEHRRFRGKTKVWRKNLDEAQNGTISKSAIQFALKTMGVINEGINQYFSNLLGEHIVPFHHQKTGFDDNERLIESRNVFQQHPLQQDICPPHFHLFPGTDIANDEIMDIDDDDDRLDDVLYEEKMLDEEEILIDKTHENTLWSKVPLSKQTLSY